MTPFKSLFKFFKGQIMSEEIVKKNKTEMFKLTYRKGL